MFKSPSPYSFDQLPIAVYQLSEQISELKQLVEELQRKAPLAEEETPVPIADAANFMNCAVQTVYQNIRKIPHTKRFGRLYFYKSELAEYLKSGK